MRTRKTVALVLLGLLGCGTAEASEWCLPPVDNDTVEVDSVEVVEVDSVAAEEEDLKELKRLNSPYNKIVNEGGSMQEGMFVVRHIKDDWYWEVPDSLLGRLLLVVTRFSGVPQGFKKFSGEEVNRSAVYLEAYGEKSLFLREYVLSQYAPEGDRIAESLRQSTVDPIVQKFEVIGRNPDTGAQLVSVTKWLMQDNKIVGLSATDRTELSVGGLQSDRTFIDTIKAYPINVEVQTLRTYSMTAGKSPASKTGSATLSLNTSFVLLPKEPMRPRYADERVGYFNNKITSFRDDKQKTEHEAIVSRYRLEPKDVKTYRAGHLVEPKKQIVYYIDPATPKQWVPYLKAGINDWQKAFEAAGFKNAIVAKDWPDDPSMSLDDARFSVLRYLPSETENAYGPRIVDPRSGEIIESHIGWYHNVMNLVKMWYMVQCGVLDKRAQKMDFPDELMGQLIRFVSSHEVGHTLGLRHNMIASQATPTEKLRDKAWVEKNGHTASIMDYARFNYVAQPEDKLGEKGLFPRINDYDKWAIRWGYQYRPEFKDAASEKKALRTETTQKLTGNRRLWWSGDEGRGQDPRSQTEDLGDNQMVSNDYGVKNLQRVMQHILTWTAQPDGQYDDLRTVHHAVCSQFQRYVNHVQRYIGGKYVNNAPGPLPYEYVPRQRQKEAVEWIGRHVMDAPLWLYPEPVISRLGTDASSEIRVRQSAVLTVLLSPNVLVGLHNAELNSTSTYRVGDYLDDVFAIVWKPQTDPDERKNDFRRQLERSYVDYVGQWLNPVESSKGVVNQVVQGSDAVLYAEQHLDKIEAYLKSQPAEGLSGLHYKNLLLRVKKIREQYESGKK